MEFSGRLTAFPPSDLLQWARNDGRTGTLIFRRSTREKKVVFQNGLVVSCVSDDPGEFYGQHLLLGGHISEGDLIRALTRCAHTGQRLGQALQELRILLPKTIQETLRGHIQDLVLDLFLWERGVFYFAANSPPPEEILPSPIDTLHLAVEGARWQDEQRRLRQVFVHDDIVLHQGKTPEGLRVSTRQKWVLDKVNGRRTLGQVHRAIGGSYFRFLQSVLDLCVREVLDITEVAPSERSTTQELSLYRLMLEEGERERGGQQHQSETVTPSAELGMNSPEVPDAYRGVPLTVLKRLVPVWFGGHLPDVAEQSFYARCDGKSRLGEILSKADQDRELDLLFVALRRGALALLPAPVDELEAADARADGAGERWWKRILSSPRSS